MNAKRRQRGTVSHRILGGSAQEILAALSEIRSEAGVPIEWIARSHFSDISYARQAEIASALAEDVLPYAPEG